jgi:hypothetical protein
MRAEIAALASPQRAATVLASWWRPLGWVAASIFALALFALSVPRIYDFNSPNAWRVVGEDSRHYLDVVTRLPNGWPLVIGIFVFVAAAGGVGFWVVRLLITTSRDIPETLLLAVAVGLIVYTYAFLAIGWLRLLRAPVVLTLVAIGLAVGVPPAVNRLRSSGLPLRDWPRPERLHIAWPFVGRLALIFAIAGSLYVALLGALSPEAWYDARWYHLAVPVDYARHGGIYDLVQQSHLLVSALTPYQELLYSGLVPWLGAIGAKLLHWADAVLATLALIYLGSKYFRSRTIGLFAGFVLVSTPEIIWSSTTGSNDLPGAFLTVLVLLCLLRWIDNQERGWLVMAALLAGYLIGVKPFGAFTVGLLVITVVGLSLWRARFRAVMPAVANAALIGAVAFAACVPWMLHTYRLTGDPVFPALYRVFNTPHWSEFDNAYPLLAIAAYGASWTGRGLIELPWLMTVHGQLYRSLLGPAFLAAAPFVLMGLTGVRARMTILYRFLAAFLVCWMLIWWMSGLIVLRYAEAILPVLALLIAAAMIGYGDGLGIPKPVRAFGLTFTVIFLLLNSQFLLPFQRHSSELLVEARAVYSWRYLYDGQPERDALIVPPIVWYLDDTLGGSNAKVFDGVGLIEYHLYSTVDLYNGWIRAYDSPTYVEGWGILSPDAYSKTRDVGITHVVTTTELEPQLRQSALWPHLERVPLPAYVGPHVQLYVLLRPDASPSPS